MRKLKKVLINLLACIMMISSLGIFSACTPSHYYAQALIKAIKEDNEAYFDELLKMPLSLDTQPYLWGLDRVNLPPLNCACYEGKYEYVVKLVEAGADINNANDNNRTPLMLALASYEDNRFDIARYLIDHGADVTIEVRPYGTALDYVFSSNSGENYSRQVEEDEYNFARFLMDCGADIENVSIGHFIIEAARGNNALMVDYLIKEKNVDIDFIGNSRGYTSLMWAVYFNCHNVIEYLIENGADLEIVNEDGKTARDIALEKGDSKTLELLNLANNKI